MSYVDEILAQVAKQNPNEPEFNQTVQEVLESIIAYVRAKHNSMGSNIETLYHVFDDRAEAIEFRITQESEVVGVPLKNLKMKKNLLIACIFRKGKVMIPGGNDEIQIGDTVIVVTMQTGFNEIDDVLEA